VALDLWDRQRRSVITSLEREAAAVEAYLG
jgi:hypothetical protein